MIASTVISEMCGEIVNGNFDDLHPKFVSSMKVLFDILDDGEMGYILLSDLEKWWDATDLAQGDDRPAIPTEALDSLRKITPPNGRLSFERFIAGLKLSLLKIRLQNIEGNYIPEKKVNLVHNGHDHGYYSELDLHTKADTVKVSETTHASIISLDQRRPRTYSVSRLNEAPTTTDARITRSNNSSNSEQEKIMTESRQSKHEQKGNLPSWNDTMFKSLQDNVLLKLDRSNASSARNPMGL